MAESAAADESPAAAGERSEVACSALWDPKPVGYGIGRKPRTDSATAFCSKNLEKNSSSANEGENVREPLGSEAYRCWARSLPLR